MFPGWLCYCDINIVRQSSDVPHWPDYWKSPPVFTRAEALLAGGRRGETGESLGHSQSLTAQLPARTLIVAVNIEMEFSVLYQVTKIFIKNYLQIVEREEG